MFEALFGKDDRQLELRTNFRYDVKVSDFTAAEKAQDNQAENFFKVSTHIEYTKTLRNSIFLIGCALSNRQLSLLFDDPRCEYRWLLPTRDETFRESDFRVVRVCVDNEAVPIVRSETTDRGFEIWCGGGDSLRKKLNRQVRMKIEIETKKFRSNNLFSVFLVYPTRGLDIAFNYEGMDLKNLREISFFAGKHPYPEVTKEEGKQIRLRISDDEWIFPNSGVTFLWDL